MQYFGDQESRLRIFNFEKKLLLMHLHALSIKIVNKF